MTAFSIQLADFVEANVPMGEFIFLKQCRDMGIDHENIPMDRLEDLVERIAKASEMFLGYEKSRKLKDKILRQKFDEI